MTTSDTITSTKMRTLVPTVESYSRAQLSDTRFRHCEGVARRSEELCRRFGIDAEKGYLAGIAHDFTREWPAADLVQTALEDGYGLSEMERAKPLLLHGRAAAVTLGNRFGVDDPDVLEAIRFHTLGAPGLGPLAHVLYCADYLEPGRPEANRRLYEGTGELDLPELVCAVVDHTAAHGKSLAEPTRAMYRELKSQESHSA